MKVRYTLPALAELEAILSYVAERSPQGAVRVRTRIQTLLELLSSQPRIGTRTDDPTILRVVMTPFPYLAFYEVAKGEIIVHSVRHAAGDPATMPGSTQR